MRLKFFLFLVFSFFLSFLFRCQNHVAGVQKRLVLNFNVFHGRLRGSNLHTFTVVFAEVNIPWCLSFPERFRLLFYYTHRRQNVHYSSVNVCFIRMIMLNTSWFSRDIRVFIVQNFRGEPCFITYAVHNVWYALSRKKKREIEGWRAKFFRSLSISCGYHQSQRKIAAFGTFCKLCDNSVRWREVHLATIYNAEIVVCDLWNWKWWIRLFQLR